ncbi:hypothetical protein PMAYCL1PPCAC_25292 [Pristionchus mayeri]|uniref:F-box domain-containing protein n=1 Tax=Pristionchus mayeri TaxID=1317129 RepID=A0AAN5D2X9_9BILA|nr:hypothetical protein PMAYCL1PPCAC_25283 [Pristionchus mayeri]GMR55097.1 hypothetical protein PMAYCL1PPCAC_25292 [Pristionchus mayeri]
MQQRLKGTDNRVCIEEHLAEDCLLDIFSRLDHDDLDELSTISTKMLQLANISRSSVIKLNASTCFVLQV